MSSSILAPIIAGAARDITGSLASSFYVSAALLVIGLVAMLFLKENAHKEVAVMIYAFIKREASRIP